MSEPSIRRVPGPSPEHSAAAANGNSYDPSGFVWTGELTAALRLFQRHGVSARRHALTLAQDAAGRNDAAGQRWWEAVSRLLS